MTRQDFDDEIKRIINLYTSQFTTEIKDLPDKKVNQVQLAILKYFNITYKDFIGNKRYSELVEARHLFFYICKENNICNLAKIARMTARNHATVIHGHESIKNKLAIYPELREKLNEILKMIV